MLVNVSYNKPELKCKINMLVGEPFTLSERFKLNGIGSGKININSACLAIHNLLILCFILIKAIWFSALSIRLSISYGIYPSFV